MPGFLEGQRSRLAVHGRRDIHAKLQVRAPRPHRIRRAVIPHNAFGAVWNGWNLHASSTVSTPSPLKRVWASEHEMIRNSTSHHLSTSLLLEISHHPCTANPKTNPGHPTILPSASKHSGYHTSPFYSRIFPSSLASGDLLVSFTSPFSFSFPFSLPSKCSACLSLLPKPWRSGE